MTLQRTKELIGDLRHRVTVQRPIETQDSEQETVEKWETIGTYWASIKPLRGREFWQAQQANSLISHRVYMRARLVEIKPNYRLLFRGRKLNVEYVMDEEERGVALVMMCKEVIE